VIAGGVDALVDDMRAAMETRAAAKPAVPAGNRNRRHGRCSSRFCRSHGKLDAKPRCHMLKFSSRILQPIRVPIGPHDAAELKRLYEELPFAAMRAAETLRTNGMVLEGESLQRFLDEEANVAEIIRRIKAIQERALGRVSKDEAPHTPHGSRRR
jgi:hypothetical protein